MKCSGKDTDGSVGMVMSTGDLDRDKEKIDQSGWVLDNYRKNPVVLWSHDWNIPAIGYMKNIEAGKSLSGEIVFNDRETDAFGWGIGQRLLKGSLRCGSVGFRVIEAEIVNHKANPSETADVIYRKQELLEFSICNIPANPFALAEGKGLEHQADRGLYEFLRRGGLQKERS